MHHEFLSFSLPRYPPLPGMPGRPRNFLGQWPQTPPRLASRLLPGRPRDCQRLTVLATAVDGRFSSLLKHQNASTSSVDFAWNLVHPSRSCRSANANLQGSPSAASTWAKSVRGKTSLALSDWNERERERDREREVP